MVVFGAAPESAAGLFNKIRASRHGFSWGYYIKFSLKPQGDCHAGLSPCPLYNRSMEEIDMTLGSHAPDFTLPDQNGVSHSLSDYQGQWVLLYFYPKDDTPGCTKEACMIRDAFPRFETLNAVVLGVSVDSVASHKKFAEKYKLPFTLLSDEHKKVVNLYHVWAAKRFLGREYEGTLRTSFLIDPEGDIEKIYHDVKPAKHAEEVLHDLRESDDSE